MGENEKIYFPGLNGIRFIAAFSVIIHHVEQTKYWGNLPNVWGKSILIDNLGHSGVSLFFTLSGFLITYLLLAEIKKTSTVDVVKFYIRRTLRIWPLYYFITLFTFFLLPQLVTLPGISDQHYTGFGIKLFLYVILLPNIARQMFGNALVIGSNQAWSVGIEEQFYAYWPWLIRWFKNHIFKFLVAFILLKTLVSVILKGVIIYYPDAHWLHFVRFADTAWRFLQVEQMAVGAMAAYLLFNGIKPVIKFFYHPAVMWADFALLVGSQLVKVDFLGYSIIEAVIYSVVILNISTNPLCPIKLNAKWLQKMGDISYGIYMYHTICLALVAKLLMDMDLPKTSWIGFNVLMYTVPAILTVGVSWISYHYFEQWFINLKKRFMVVKSSTYKEESREQEIAEQKAALDSMQSNLPKG